MLVSALAIGCGSSAGELPAAVRDWVLVTGASDKLYQCEFATGREFRRVLESLVAELSTVYRDMDDWSVSPDGSQLSFTGKRHDALGTDHLCVVPTAGPAAAVRELFPYRGPSDALAWSPDSRRVAFDYYEPVPRDDGTLTRRFGLRVVDVDGENGVTFWNTIDRVRGVLGFSPDAKRILFVRRQPRGEVIALDIGDGTQEQLHLPGLGLGAPSRIAWLPEGRLAYDGLPRGAVAVARFGDLEPEYVIKHDEDGWTYACSPDGAWIVVKAKRPNVVPSPRAEYFLFGRDGSKVKLELDSDNYRDFTWLPRPGLAREPK